MQPSGQDQEEIQILTHFLRGNPIPLYRPKRERDGGGLTKREGKIQNRTQIVTTIQLHPPPPLPHGSVVLRLPFETVPPRQPYPS